MVWCGVVWCGVVRCTAYLGHGCVVLCEEEVCGFDVGVHQRAVQYKHAVRIGGVHRHHLLLDLRERERGGERERERERGREREREREQREREHTRNEK